MSDAYLGNPNLKKVNTPVEFTKEQVIEFRKCENDPLYFISKYVQIVSLDEGLVPFNLYGFQEEMVQTMHKERFTICDADGNEIKAEKPKKASKKKEKKEDK